MLSINNKKMRNFKLTKSVFTCFGTALVLILINALIVEAQVSGNKNNAGTTEQRTSRYFELIRPSPPEMLAFLKKMPKGGDLHNHLSGAIYAESFIRWASDNGFCVNQETLSLSLPPCEQVKGQIPASTAFTNQFLYRQLVDSWSTRHWQFSGKNGHDQFFDSFAKFGAVTRDHTGQMLAEVAARSARGHVLYLELMLTPDGAISKQIGQKVGWDGNFESTLNKLKSSNIAEASSTAVKWLQNAEAEKDKLLKCGTSDADPGCAVTIRYISQVARGGSLGQVFAQMVTGFALASDSNSKVVALNLVEPEDWFLSMQNFPVHMEMLNFLRPLYPTAHITLHASELAPGMVSPEGLTFHIRDSVLKGHAERIGHGVSIMYEDDPYGLLKELAERNVMIEICLTSNETILGIKKEQHPLPIYLKYNVPVALATDDEGVSRSEISREFLKAAEDHGLGYLQLKRMARNSLQYAFLPGGSLWADTRKFVPVSQCIKDISTMVNLTVSCRQYLDASEKARLQWKLEQEFRVFESNY
jgi:adenosine deaminase